jgi:hypothetical protein
MTICLQIFIVCRSPGADSDAIHLLLSTSIMILSLIVVTGLLIAITNI